MEAYIEEAEVLLRRYGGHPYGTIESAIRRFLYCNLLRREIGLNRIPPLAVTIINRLQLLYPVKRCAWSQDGWQIVEAHIV